MSRTEEGQLAARLKHGLSKSDRDRLITSNLRYVVRVALRYRGCGLPLEDLINEGNVGLIEAVRRYDPKKGTRFLTYATWWIRKEILGALGNQTLVRVPAHRQRQIRRARQEKDALLIEAWSNQRTPSAELQRAAEIRDALLGTRSTELSLEDVWGTNDDRPVDDRMPSQNPIDPETELIRDETMGEVRSAMDRLTDVERKIIRGRFGMGDADPRTLQEMGTDLGISRERVRQIEIKAKDEIRRALNSRPRRGRFVHNQQRPLPPGTARVARAS